MIFQLVEPFQGSFSLANNYPGWPDFAAYPGLRCATPGVFAWGQAFRLDQIWNYWISWWQVANR